MYAEIVKDYLLPSTDLVRLTQDDLHTKDRFQDLVKLIDFSVETFCINELGIDKHDLKMTGMWAHAHKSNSIHHMHVHPNSFISGVLYLQIPESEREGDLIFSDPRAGKNMQYLDFKKESCLSNRTMIIKPNTGLLLLFPSWLEHGTDVFVAKDNQLRISLSFNYSIISCKYPTMKL